MKTTNYYNTFIEVAEDSLIEAAEIPPKKGTERTAANIQFEIISDNPYKYTSDDVLFQVFAEKNKVTGKELISEREKIFFKGTTLFSFFTAAQTLWLGCA
ncbi:MAG: DUF6157 family protein [Segetibacter sp.]